jgi:Transposase domain (DUF772)
MHSGEKQMGMGTRRRRQRQEQLWISHDELAKGPGHPFYKRVNELLEMKQFDEFAEKECARFYAENNGRPSVTPGIYFRLLLVGHFEGIDSERGIAWRAADSVGLRKFLGVGLDEQTPDHSTISRTRRLIDVETHRKVFFWILRSAAGAVSAEHGGSQPGCPSARSCQKRSGRDGSRKRGQINPGSTCVKGCFV